MNKEWVVCLGAGESQLPLIKKAKSLGYKVLAIDRNNLSPGFSFADDTIIESTHNKDIILEKIKGKHLKGLLARSNGNALFTAASIAKYFKIPGVSNELATIATSKSALRQFSLANSIKMPFGTVVSSSKQVKENFFKYQVIVKPDFTKIGKKSITKVEQSNKNKFFNAIDLALCSSGNKAVEIEEFIDGYDCTYFTWIKNGIPSILLTWDELNSFDKNSNLFQLGISMPSISLFINHSKEVNKVINKFAKLFPKVSTLLAFSFRIDTKGTPWLIEVHADLTGDQILDKLAPEATNCDCLLEIVKLFVNKSLSIPSCLSKFSKLKPSALIQRDKFNNRLNNKLISNNNFYLLHKEVFSLTGYDIINR
jgi:hypothetical protein